MLAVVVVEVLGLVPHPLKKLPDAMLANQLPRDPESEDEFGFLDMTGSTAFMLERRGFGHAAEPSWILVSVFFVS